MKNVTLCEIVSGAMVFPASTAGLINFFLFTPLEILETRLRVTATLCQSALAALLILACVCACVCVSHTPYWLKAHVHTCSNSHTCGSSAHEVFIWKSPGGCSTCYIVCQMSILVVVASVCWINPGTCLSPSCWPHPYFWEPGQWIS